MAATFQLSSQSYQGRYLYLSCTQEKDTANNKSIIRWTLTSTGGTAGYYSTGPTTVVINGQTVYYAERKSWETREFPARKDTEEDVIEVAHDIYGDKTITCSISTAIFATNVETHSGEWELDRIDRQAFIQQDSVQPWNDEQEPFFSFQEAGTGTLTAWIEPEYEGTRLCQREGIPNTGTYTWELSETEKNQLRAACTKNSCAVRIGLMTTISGVNYTDYAPTTFSVINAMPTLTATVEESAETKDEIKSIVGSQDVLVRNRSKVVATGYPICKKQASTKSYCVKNGENVLTANPATFAVVDSGTFVFSLTDSRDNSAEPVTITKTVVPYVGVSCSLDKVWATVDGTGAVISVMVSGNYYNGDIGDTANALTLKCRYREKGASQWVDGGTIPNTKQDGTYSGTTSIRVSDYTKAYEIQAYAGDVFETVYSTTRIARAVPLFDYGAYGFRFNVPVDIAKGTICVALDSTSPFKDITLWATSSECNAGMSVVQLGAGTIPTELESSTAIVTKAETGDRINIYGTQAATGAVWTNTYKDGAWSGWKDTKQISEQVMDGLAYYGDTDSDENQLNAWFDAVLANMKAYSGKQIMVDCSQVAFGTPCYGTLFKQADELHATALLFANNETIFIKAKKEGVWQNHKMVADATEEQGTVDGWIYKKLSNGYAECYCTKEFTVDCTTSWDELFESEENFVDFPFPFARLDYCNMGMQASSVAGEAKSSWIAIRTEATTTKSQGFMIMRPTSKAGVTVKVCIEAKGTWK